MLINPKARCSAMTASAKVGDEFNSGSLVIDLLEVPKPSSTFFSEEKDDPRGFDFDTQILTNRASLFFEDYI